MNNPNQEQVIDLFPQIESEPMRHVLHEEKSTLNQTTIRLLRCRDHVRSKTKVLPDGTPEIKAGPARNELCASFYDDKKTKYRDFIRMLVADTLPEAMPEFLTMSVKEIERLIPKFKKCDKVAKTDCITVYSFEGFAEALQRK